MPISVIRKATADDRIRCDRAAIAFCLRHNVRILEPELFSPVDCLDIGLGVMWLDASDPAAHREVNRLRGLWARCLCRALRVKYDRRICIEYGYVGLHLY